MNGRDGAIRHQYERHGIAGYYSRHGGVYRNPHERVVRQVISFVVQRWRLDLTRVLDLACGSGEVTLALRELGAGQVDGVDPFTGDAYLSRTGQRAEGFSFEHVAAGSLAPRRYSLIVCSFAMHLIERSFRIPIGAALQAPGWEAGDDLPMTSSDTPVTSGFLASSTAFRSSSSPTRA